MSQLDYLWTTYGPYTVSDSIDVEDSIPSSKAIKDAIATQVTGIVELDTQEEGNKVRVIGKEEVVRKYHQSFLIKILR